MSLNFSKLKKVDFLFLFNISNQNQTIFCNAWNWCYPVLFFQSLTSLVLTLVNVFISVNSCSSTVTSCTSVGGTKYDLDLLKSDVSHAKSRVQRLKRELANIDSEMMYKQRGVDTLARFAIFQKYFERRAGAPRAIRYRMAIQTPPHQQ